MGAYLICCGGTGGHLAPGIALASGLVARGHGAVLLISRKKVDARLIEKYPQFRFERLPAAPLSWSPAGFARFVISQVQGFVAGLRLVRRLRPACVVGFGGFTTASLIVAGMIFRVPVALHEANRVPGRAIRLLGRVADRVYLPPGVSLSGARPGRVKAAGLPVRDEIVKLPRDAARRALGLDPAARVVSVFGGSQGATALNEWARREAPRLAAAGVQLYCVTGMGKGSAADEVVTNPGPAGAPVRAVFSPFCDRVAELLSASDLVVARAGAGSLAEFVRIETPAVLVPYPHAADNHQAANAAYFELHGGGVVVDQAKIDGLSRAVDALIGDDVLLERFRANLRLMGREDPRTAILDDLQQLSNRAGGAHASAGVACA